MPTFTKMINLATQRLHEAKAILDGTSDETYSDDITAVIIAEGRADMAHDIAMAAFWMSHRQQRTFSDRCQEIARAAERVKERAHYRWQHLRKAS